ncbi:hypothetical protein [Natronomonas sp.]|uniref:hypothetical protein n=1 Tax=Natronomonas sp. TaxID=2184060 RepID=UPI002635640D|nr:hypothetical protein [Natronomonas sp.]
MSADEPTADTERVRASLRRLAGPAPEVVVERAVEATGDLEAAAEFAGTVGTEALGAAIEATDDPETERRGRRALACFRRFRSAAAGAEPPGQEPPDHFHRGHGTDLTPDHERPTK